MDEDKLKKFETEKISTLVLNNVIPSIISMIMVLVYNLADTFFIGQTNNPLMVAAVSQATPAFMLFMSVGTIFGIGGTSLISRLMGMRQAEKAKKVSSFAFWTGLVIGLVGMIFFWIALEPISRLLGASDETLDFVKSYLQIVAFGIPFLVLSSSFSNILRAEGKPQKAMLGMIIGNLSNIVLDPIFILVFHMDVAGAALATVISNVISAVFYIYHFLSGKSILSIHPKNFQMKDGIASGVFSIGIPASFNSLLMGISIIFLNNFLVSYGNMAVAGMGVASKMGMMLGIMLVGFGLGVQPLFGYFYGSNNRERFFATLRFSLIFSTVMSFILTLLVYFGTNFLVGAFLSDAEAYSYGVRFTRILVYSGPVLGVLFVLNNAIQGMGKALPALILSTSRQGLIYIPMLFVIDRIAHSANMLTFAQTITDYITAGLAVLLFVLSSRKDFALPKLPANA